MYKILCDGNTLHDVRDEEYRLLSPRLTLELNKTGNLEFDILTDHPHIGDIQKLKSSVSVYEDNELLYCGRPTTSESDFYNSGQVTCEGELAFLLDSVQRPHSYGTNTADSAKTNIDIFKKLIAEHNNQVEDAKKFAIGTIDIDSATVTSLSTNYEKTWDFINSNFLGKYDGYLRVRHDNGIRYLDYVKQYGKVSNQAIRFSENLLDLKKHVKADDIVTAIIPIGKNNVTIKNATGQNGIDYIYDQNAVDLYGWIFEKVDFSDISDPNTLLAEAKKYLQEKINLAITIELTAVDLHMVDVDINAIRLGDLVPCVSKQHGLLSTLGDISTYYLVSKYEMDLENPANNKIILGRTINTLTDQMAGTATMENRVQTAVNSANAAQNAVNNVTGNIESIKQDMDSMLSRVYPVGSIYISVNGTDPETLFGGSWERFAIGRTLVGVDENDDVFQKAGNLGGEKAHTLTTQELASHNHGSVNLKGLVQFRDINTSDSNLVLSASGIISKSYPEWSGTHAAMTLTNKTSYKYNRLDIDATHSHSPAGGGAAHNNLQPYITVYMWKRTA